MKRPKIKIRRTWVINAWEYYYLVVAANGETLVTSEMFTRKADAKRAVKALRRALVLAKTEDYT